MLSSRAHSGHIRPRSLHKLMRSSRGHFLSVVTQCSLPAPTRSACPSHDTSSARWCASMRPASGVSPVKSSKQRWGQARPLSPGRPRNSHPRSRSAPPYTVWLREARLEFCEHAPLGRGCAGRLFSLCLPGLRAPRAANTNERGIPHELSP